MESAVRKRHLRCLVTFVVLLTSLFVTSALCVDDQGTIIIVRHAEKVSDPYALLSAAGEQRAKCLAHLLSDANVKAIFTSNIKRTHQTAEPLAEEQHVTIVEVSKDSQPELIRKALAAAHNGAVLIVGHSETVASIVQQLGGGVVPPVGLNEFDRLTILHLNSVGASVTTLRYCDCGTSTAPASSPADQGMTPSAVPHPRSW